MNFDEILTIDTPENVAFGYDIAGIGSRFLAALADSFIILLLQGLVYLVLILFLGSFDLFQSDNAAWIIGLFGLISFGLLWGYYIFFELLWNGQTPGKRWAGLRVIRADGTPISLAESLVRNLVRLVDFLPIYYGVGVVTMFINRQSRRLGDLAAGTLVVRERKSVSIDALDQNSQALHLVGFQFTAEDLNLDLPVDKLTLKDIQVAEDFLRRRFFLPNRESLAGQILHSLYDRMEKPIPLSVRHHQEKIMALIIHLYRESNQTGDKDAT